MSHTTPLPTKLRWAQTDSPSGYELIQIGKLNQNSQPRKLKQNEGNLI